MSERTMRMGGVAALLFVALIIVTILSGGSPPAADDSAEKIRTYFVDHRGALIAGKTSLKGVKFAGLLYDRSMKDAHILV